MVMVKPPEKRKKKFSLYGQRMWTSVTKINSIIFSTKFFACQKRNELNVLQLVEAIQTIPLVFSVL